MLRYIGDSGLDADDWIPILMNEMSKLGLPLGKIWLPSDAKAKTFQSKHTSMEKFVAGFGADKVAVVPQSKKLDQIEASRDVIGRCAFNESGCEEGLDGLRAWEFDYNFDLAVFSRNPKHNWASHPADAFSYGCQVMEMDYKAEEVKDEIPIDFVVGQKSQVTIDELWNESGNSRRHRI